MKAFNYLLMCALGAGAPAAYGLEPGQCGTRAELTAALAREGQHVIVTARQADGPLRISANDDHSLGYLLTGGRRLCVGARLTALRVEKPRNAAFLAWARTQQACAGAAQAAGGPCPPVLKAANRKRRLDVVLVVHAGPSQALAAARGTRFVAVRSPENWDGAQFGFCRRPDRGLQLCMSSHTVAP